MATVIKQLVAAKLAESSQTAQYTAVNCRAVIDKFTATNVSGSNATLSVNLIASGGAAGNGNLITKTRTIAPNEAYTFPELVGHVLESGGIISTIASAANALTIRVSGREIT